MFQVNDLLEMFSSSTNSIFHLMGNAEKDTEKNESTDELVKLMTLSALISKTLENWINGYGQLSHLMRTGWDYHF